MNAWRSAHDESGPRSTFRRARRIAASVFDVAAPLPDVTPSPDRNAFLQEVVDATRAAVEAVGATLH